MVEEDEREKKLSRNCDNGGEHTKKNVEAVEDNNICHAAPPPNERANKLLQEEELFSLLRVRSSFLSHSIYNFMVRAIIFIFVERFLWEIKMKFLTVCFSLALTIL